MTTREGRGGARTPRRPAAVSGPGALSARTDGRAGQPIRTPTGGPYGQRQALEQQQRAAPLASGRTPAPASGGGSPGVGPAPAPLAQPPQNPLARFSPQATDDQPVVFPRDPDAMLRALFRVYPHPDIGRYLRS